MAVSSKTVFEVADIVATVVVYNNHNHFFSFFQLESHFPGLETTIGRPEAATGTGSETKTQIFCPKRKIK